MKTYKEEATGRKVVRALNESRLREKQLEHSLAACLKITDKYASDDTYEDSITDAARELLAEKPVHIIDCELVLGKTAGPAKAELMDVELEIAFGPVEYNERRAESIRFKKVVVFMKGMLLGVLIGFGASIFAMFLTGNLWA